MDFFTFLEHTRGYAFVRKSNNNTIYRVALFWLYYEDELELWKLIRNEHEDYCKIEKIEFENGEIKEEYLITE